MRTFYRCLLRLHPPAFRGRFTGQMLWIFDETNPAGRPVLFLDCFVSIARQWVLRSGAWKALAAAGTALVQITAGGLIWLALRQVDAVPHRVVFTPEAAAMAGLMRWIAALSGALVLVIVAVSLWFGRFAAGRTRRG